MGTTECSQLLATRRIEVSTKLTTAQRTARYAARGRAIKKLHHVIDDLYEAIEQLNAGLARTMEERDAAEEQREQAHNLEAAYRKQAVSAVRNACQSQLKASREMDLHHQRALADAKRELTNALQALDDAHHAIVIASVNGTTIDISSTFRAALLAIEKRTYNEAKAQTLVPEV